MNKRSTKKLPGLSVVVIAHNAVALLPRLFKSVASIAQEIVVINLESSDDTGSWATRHGAVVYEHKNAGYGDPVKNFALSTPNYEWILLLDADEWIPEELAQRITALVQEDGQVNGYYLSRCNFIFGQQARGGWWPDYQLRFFRFGTVNWPTTVHSQPSIIGQAVQLPAVTKLALQHDNYPTVEEYVRRLNLYTSLEVKKSRKLVSPIRAFFQELQDRFFHTMGADQYFFGEALCVLQAGYMGVAKTKQLESTGYDYPGIDNSSLEDLCQEYAYWYFTYRLAKATNVVERLYWKLQRKRTTVRKQKQPEAAAHQAREQKTSIIGRYFLGSVECKSVSSYLDEVNSRTNTDSPSVLGRNDQSPLLVFWDEFLRMYLAEARSQGNSYTECAATLRAFYKVVVVIKAAEKNGLLSIEKNMYEVPSPQEIWQKYQYWKKRAENNQRME